jgi:hypothetical protein
MDALGDPTRRAIFERLGSGRPLRTTGGCCPRRGVSAEGGWGGLLVLYAESLGSS